MSQAALFSTRSSATAPPAGFGYWPDAFTADEERDWLREIEALPFKPFEFHGYLGKRRIVSFGWRYDYMGRALRESEPMPAFIAPLQIGSRDPCLLGPRAVERRSAYQHQCRDRQSPRGLHQLIAHV